jgi:hypothetical protein
VAERIPGALAHVLPGPALPTSYDPRTFTLLPEPAAKAGTEFCARNRPYRNATDLGFAV